MKLTDRVKSARGEKSQSFGLSLNEDMVFSAGKVEDAVRGIAAGGYGIVRAMLRNTNLNHRDACVVDAVSRLTRVAHELGVLAVFDCEPHSDPVGRDMGKLFPDAMAVRLVRAEGKLANGHFLLHFPKPGSDNGVGESPMVKAAYLRRADGTVERLKSFSYNQRVEHEVYDNGYTTSEDQYVEGRPARHRMHTRLSGALPGGASGTIIVYAGFIDRKKVDFWSEGCRCYYQQVLECYRDIPLDGIGWDEPGQGGDWSHYLAGDAFFAAFERLNGYSLADKLYLLDEPGTGIDAVRVRLDYYRTLNEGLFQAQRDVIAMARQFFGEDLLLGTHHTWQGEGNINDYRAGAVDYFRLNQNMDAGYTDCCWWDPFSVAYSYTLASALGRLAPSGASEVNTWHFKPTNSLVEYNARLMTLMNIGWFNIWYGEMSDTCLYPSHYTWATTVREARRHREAQRLIGEARPVVEMAMLHGWESVAGINRANIAGAHKTFCLNTAKLFVDRNIPFDWVDTELLAEGKVEDGSFVTALGSYSILVLPYASVLPGAAWQKCAEFARVGGRLVFVGPPPEMDTEGGLLRDEFAQMLGIPPLSLGNYLEGIDARCELPLTRPEKVDVYYPLKGAPDRLLISIEDEPHGIKSAGGNVIYLTDLDPRTRLLKVIQGWISPEVICYSENILWRLYRNDARSILVLTARKDMELSGIVRFEGMEYEFEGGSVALIEQSADGFQIHGENLALKNKTPNTPTIQYEVDPGIRARG